METVNRRDHIYRNGSYVGMNWYIRVYGKEKKVVASFSVRVAWLINNGSLF